MSVGMVVERANISNFSRKLLGLRLRLASQKPAFINHVSNQRRYRVTHVMTYIYIYIYIYICVLFICLEGPLNY